MSVNCPYEGCKSSQMNPETGRFVRIGYFYRKSDSRRVARFKCSLCRRTFSSATFSRCFRQHKRRVNYPLFKLLVSGVSQRRAARNLKIHPKTVARKLKFLARYARLDQEKLLKQIGARAFSCFQFDELETFEHTKCKPLSVALVVEQESRKILGFEVARMPATGHLVHIARKKYGFRADERVKRLHALFERVRPVLCETVEPRHLVFTSDECPRYPRVMRKYFPESKHIQVKGRKSSLGGQGELKKIGFDPLFSLNHTCAMFRANVNRLIRKTWCTTKAISGLVDHLSLYVAYHNRVLTQ